MSVYQAYEPTFEAQPAFKDPTTNFTVPAADGTASPLVPNAPRCILWVAPFAGDQPLNAAGSIVDNTVQVDLRAFVAAGGRLCVTGQEVASALTFNGQANNAAGSFVFDVLNATLASTGNSVRQPDARRLGRDWEPCLLRLSV